MLSVLNIQWHTNNHHHEKRQYGSTVNGAHVTSKLHLQTSRSAAVYLVSISWVVDNCGLRLQRRSGDRLFGAGDHIGLVVDLEGQSGQTSRQTGQGRSDKA